MRTLSDRSYWIDREEIAFNPLPNTWVYGKISQIPKCWSIPLKVIFRLLIDMESGADVKMKVEELTDEDIYDVNWQTDRYQRIDQDRFLLRDIHVG